MFLSDRINGFQTTGYQMLESASVNFGDYRMSDLTIACTAEDMHPYNCDGEGKCIHCDKRPTIDHDPNECALCNDADPYEVEGME